MQTTEPLSIEEAADSLLQPIETEVEDETDGETQEAETEAVDDEAEDDASEVEDENSDEAEEADDTDEGDDEEPETDEDTADDETLIEVKADGETRKVTLQELKNSFAGQASLQRRHMELKSSEEQLQAAAQAMQQERQAFLQFAQQAQENGFKRPPVEPDPALMQTDPIGYVEKEAKYRQEFREYQQEQQQLEFEQQRQAEIQRRYEAQERTRQQQLARELVPELRDEKAAEEFQQKLIKALREYHYTDEEIGGVKDDRLLPIIRDAALYRELQAGKQAAKQPKQESKPITRPKAKLRDGGKQAIAKKKLQQARKTQSLEDWADLLLE